MVAHAGAAHMKRKAKAKPAKTQLTPASDYTTMVRGTGGRPAYQLTDKAWKQVEAMAVDLCTVDDIADYLMLDKRILYNAYNRERFERTMKAKAASTRWAVRQRQHEKAVSGNPVDSIWWGKQHLGQSDRQAVTGANGGPLEIALASVEDMTALLDKLAAKEDKS